ILPKRTFPYFDKDNTNPTRNVANNNNCQYAPKYVIERLNPLSTNCAMFSGNIIDNKTNKVNAPPLKANTGIFILAFKSFNNFFFSSINLHWIIKKMSYDESLNPHMTFFFIRS